MKGFYGNDDEKRRFIAFKRRAESTLGTLILSQDINIYSQ
jgi:hypothetical protein